MPIETYEDVCEQIRDILSDSTVPGGDQYTDAALRLPVKSAWNELMSEMTNDQVPPAERIVAVYFPSYTAQLIPGRFNIKDLRSITWVEERLAPARVMITDCTATADGEITVVATAHGRSNNDRVQVAGILGVPAANGAFFVTVTDANNLVLKGSQFQGLYVSGGYVTQDATGGWTEVVSVEVLPDRDPDDKLSEYEWRDNTLYFVGSTSDRQLRLTYFSSNAPPFTGDSLVYDGITNALAFRAAAIVGYNNDRHSEAADWDAIAKGPNLDGHGGHFQAFLSAQVRKLQNSQLFRRIDPPAHLVDLILSE